MKRRGSYLFTSKKQSTNALVSVSMGLIALISTILMIVMTYKNGGEAQLRYGAVVFVCLFFSLTGLILAILSRREPDKWYLFSYIGIVLNGAELLICFAAVWLGVV